VDPPRKPGDETASGTAAAADDPSISKARIEKQRSNTARINVCEILLAAHINKPTAPRALSLPGSLH
jgi:hypothetical protein